MARKHGLPLVIVNQVGGNDDLIFDGHSAAFDAQGRMFARARGFTEDLMVVDLAAGTASPAAIAEESFEPEAEIWNALVLGVRGLRPQDRIQQGAAGAFRRHRFGADRRHRRRCHGRRKTCWA